MTIGILKEFGADVEDGLARCMNNEEFYLKMVTMGIADERFEKLPGVLEGGRLDEAFEVCHALKGVLGNLALTPIYEPVCEMTELLRAKKDADYAPYLEKMKFERDRLLAMERAAQ